MNDRTANWPFDTVLVANRGEIAARVVRTVKGLGLRSAVVYHPADRLTPAVRDADLAVEIRGETPVSAYLDPQQILAAAEETNAGGIHPGYGFLSENTDFARQVMDAGIAFAGPRPEQIELMGDKIRARNFVSENGFPVAPSALEDDNPDDFVERARALGTPLLIKPAAGGGGKGMHIVRDLAALEEEIARAASEGERYFGDGRLYVERYIDQPRHIEVQVLGDEDGNVVHLFERECSVQRRFQKIIEETPSPALDEATRQRICETAAGIARQAGYRGAGTVEFIFGGDNEFYFLEMNTRLQVEHPVTEEITGHDLVADQLRIAAGEPLGFTQEEITRKGHAIECRLYAEDAADGFTPTTGPILTWRPPTGESVRVDGGISEGDQVTAAFDPMLAKLIVSGADREQARMRMAEALPSLLLLGCKTNAGFLHRLVEHPAFVNGDVHTGFLDNHPEIADEPVIDPATRDKLLAAAALMTRPMRDVADTVPQLHAGIGTWTN